MKLDSYELACYCKSECMFLDRYPDQPCWGRVQVFAEIEEAGWAHACEGHHDTYEEGIYHEYE